MFKTLKTFYKFLFQEKYAFFAFLITLIFSSIFSSLLPYISKIIVDVVFYEDYAFIVFLVCFLIALRLLDSFLSTWANYLSDKVMIPVTRNLKIEVFDHVQKLDFSFHAKKATGALISAFKRGDSAFWNLHFNINFGIVSTLISLIMMIFFLSVVDPMVVLVMMVSFAVNISVGSLLVRLNVKKRAAFNKVSDKISGIITDNFFNYETVKYFSAEVKETRRIRKKFRAWVEKHWAYSMSFRLMEIVMTTISSIGALVIFLLVVDKLKNGQATPGDLIMVISFIGGFYYQFLGIIWRVRSIANNFTNIETYFSLLDDTTNIEDPDDPQEIKNIEGDVVFEGVTFNYPKGKEGALSNFNTHIPAGQVVAFVGESGSGKTTLARLLLRLYDPDQGKIKIDQIDIKDIKQKDLHSVVGIVPQEPILFNDTIGFNIGFGKRNPTLKEIQKAAKLANIHDFIETLPKKYKTQVGERGIKLSGGQKQRVAIARTILADPKIIVFDEATSQLDSQSESLIQESLWKIAKNRTIIIIAHRFSTIMGADKIIVLEDGGVAQTGSHQDLAKKKGIYKKLKAQTDIVCAFNFLFQSSFSAKFNQ